ncbi:uncharacterized protein LOC131888918 [Tigriopus californicus]|uniref:uncharacterized protein LOC131888918 n=1 Tax=Tigriopus californicus TaxID=6832 RepID=UPI0027DA544F|nr:uncharacterized protein LOC131888918 [Tigriopus californicus]
MESHYEHMLQETSTEMTELEASIRGKQQLMDKIQEEILSMTVKKELLSSGINKINHRHQERSEQIDVQQKEIDQKMSQFAVLAPPPCTRKSSLKYLSASFSAKRQRITGFKYNLEQWGQ